MSWDGGWRPYVSVAQRREKAAREAKRFAQKGRTLSPIQIDGRGIAASFWGKAWCDNLESYSDYSNRLPRGRTYVRNGSVIDLHVAPGVVNALVMGSSLYRVCIKVVPLADTVWTKVRKECGGKISSLVELLQGRLSHSVMETVARRGEGLFPSPKDITLSCSCPDWAEMCKHVAAALYGVGVRLDQQPELLFHLRKVNHQDLIIEAGSAGALARGPARESSLASADLSTVFGIDLELTPVSTSEAKDPRAAKRTVTPTRKKPARIPRKPVKTVRTKMRRK
jgi:uncharacterized Zn finger protein